MKIAAKNWDLIIISYAKFVASFYGSGSGKIWNPLPNKVSLIYQENNIFFQENRSIGLYNFLSESYISAIQGNETWLYVCDTN